MDTVPAVLADEPAPITAAPPRTTVGRNPIPVIPAAAVLVVALFALPAMLNSYWLQIMTAVAIYSIVTLGLGLLIGRVGMVSLCQFVMMALGAWVALRFSYATTIPFPFLVL